MPEQENLKAEDLSKSVKQAPHSEQATGHRMHCREILFTPRCSQGPESFTGPVDFSVRRTVAELRGVKLAQFSDFGLYRRYMCSTEFVTFVTFLVTEAIKLQRYIITINSKLVSANLTHYLPVLHFRLPPDEPPCLGRSPLKWETHFPGQTSVREQNFSQIRSAVVEEMRPKQTDTQRDR